MRHTDGLQLRGDLFALACVFFLYAECWWAAGLCAVFSLVRHVQAAQALANAAARTHDLRTGERRADDAPGP